MKNNFSLNLPQTQFPMKGQLNQREPGLIEFWQKKNIYEKIQNQLKNNPVFTFIDGPPYANGRIHLGTALNKILKDILVKQAVLSGKFCPFVPIWDCHGLPIELRALKKIKTKSPSEIRTACRKTAGHWMEIQKEQFKRIGVLADWENKILTMDPAYESAEIRVLADIAEKGLLYRGKRPIHWCIRLQTATSSSEVEYKNHKSPSIDVAFKLMSRDFPQDTFLIIWTTTAWTLPANQAVCLHPDWDYGLYQAGDKHFILACELAESFQKKTGLKLNLKKQFKGSSLENLSYRHPFMKRVSKTILGRHVTLSAGTGLVHTAPGHGMDDFIVGQKYNLPVSCPVDERGCFTSEIPQWEGENIFKANSQIIETLKKSKHLIHHEEIEHQYPYNPRSKSPLIIRTTYQWFLDFNHKKIPIKKTALDLIEKNIHFVPSWNKQRLAGMIKESPDWCLSRQRVWGVPLIVFYCQSCKAPLIDPPLMRKIADQMEKTGQGIEYFFSKSESELLDKNKKCPQCKNNSFKKGEDILDVWFDSGICHFAFQRLKGRQFFPADVYLEGSDQHRGWFQTSLNSSIALNQKSPFKTLITHGFVYDLEKRKMSKSTGNIIDPEDIIKQYGAEILRLWAASSDYSQDISSGGEILKRVSETYRRFRNTIRFLIGNIYDFDPEKDLVHFDEMPQLDQWMLSRLTGLSDEIIQYYEKFEFHKVYQSLNKFFTVELSSLYLDIIKDRLYTFKADGKERKSAQSALFILLENLITLMAPLTSFLSEEAYQYLPGQKKESIFLNSFKKLKWKNPRIEDQFETLLSVRQKVSKEIETLRKEKIIGSSLSAHVELNLPDDIYTICKNYPSLRELFIVSGVSLKKEKTLKIKITQAPGEKCVRCWHYDTHLDSQKLCPKCLKNLSD